MRSYRQSRFVTGFVKFTSLPGLLIIAPRYFYISDKARKTPGNFILISNHKSLVDMPLYWLHFYGKNVRFLVAEVMFNKNAFMNRLLHKVGCIRVDRDKFDFSFIEDSLDILDRGDCVGIFPSSRLPVNGVPFPFKPSAAIIAMHADAPILPCYTDGNYKFGRRCNVMIGEPLWIRDLLPEDGDEAYKAKVATEKLEKIVDDLGKELESRLEKGNK